MDRQLYYDLINVELTNDYPALLDRASLYLQELIKENSKIVKYFEYSEEALDKFLLQDNQITQEKYAKYVEENPPPRSRQDMLTYLTQLTPAKYVDGAWVQGVAKAFNTALDGDSLRSKAVNYLFNIYAEELGEGVLEMNHIAIWKDLLANLGIAMPDPASHAFAFNPDLWDSSFTVGVIQLALGTVTSSFFPEVLGYNMGFEQLPLHLLTTVDELRKLEIDPYYFQLHISIDNLASGHAAMAVTTVKLYLDDIRTRFGADVAEVHWRRVLDGFYLNEVSPMKPELASHYAKHAESIGSIEDRMVKMISGKAPFAHAIHGSREVGGCLLSRWLDPKATDEKRREFLSVLASSHWFDSATPANSKFLTELCGFGGPMFHIFTKDEIQLISEWAHSLSKTTPISPPPQVKKQTKSTEPSQTPQTPSETTNTKKTSNDAELQIAQAMADLISKKAERAKRAHGNRTMANSSGESRKINDWFSSDNVWELLDALRHTYHLDMVATCVAGNAAIDANPFMKSITTGGMSRYFDKDEVEVVRQWILWNAPIPEDLLNSKSSTSPVSPPVNTVPTNISPEPIKSKPVRTTSPLPMTQSTPISPPSSPRCMRPTPTVSTPPPTSLPTLATKSHPKPEALRAIFGCPVISKKVNSQGTLIPSHDSLFFRLMNVEAHPEAFEEARRFITSHLSDQSLNADFELLDAKTEPCLREISSMIFSSGSVSQLANVAKNVGLFFFMEGVCLQNVNMAGFHHTYSSAVLMKIFMMLANHHHFYNNLLKALRIYFPPLNSSFISKCGFNDPSAEFAILQLSLSLFPRHYYMEMLALLEWSLIMNKMVLEDLTKRLPSVGALAFDSKIAQARIVEYEVNIGLCREAIQLQLDDAHAQGVLADYTSRFGKTRSLCRQITSQFVKELSQSST